MSLSSQRAKKLSTQAGAWVATGLVATSLFASMPTTTAGAVDAADGQALGSCQPQNLAVVVDTTWSFSDNEYRQQKEQLVQFLDQLSVAPGTEVSVFFFGINAPVASVPNLIRVDISTPEGLQEAKDYITGNLAPEDRKGLNNWFTGTNWDAALTQVLKSGESFDNVIFSSDGNPNKYLNESGRMIDPGTNSYSAVAFAEALATANQITATGATITPVFVHTTENADIAVGNKPEEVARALGWMAELTGKTNPVQGVDYYEATHLNDFANKLFSAATSTCTTDLKIDKSLLNDKGTYRPDDTVEYTLTVTNAGDWDEEKASVKDLGGSYLDPESIVITPEGGAGTAVGTDWAIGKLAKGQTVTAKVTAKVAEDITGSVDAENAAYVTGNRDPYDPNGPMQTNDDVDGDIDNWDKTVISVKPGETNLKIDKKLSGTVKSGEYAQFDITVRNDGEDTEPNAIVQDLGGTGLDTSTIEFLESSKGSFAGDTWTIGELAPGETVTAKVHAKAEANLEAGSKLANAASVTGDFDPYDPSGPKQTNDGVDGDIDNWDEDTGEIEPLASDLKIAKELVTPKAELRPGGIISWKITVTNSGAGTDPKAVVTESFDEANLMANSIVVTPDSKGTYDAATGQWTIGELVPDETVTATVTAKLAENVNIVDGVTNKATIGGEYDPYDPNGQCEPNNGEVQSDTDNCDIVVTKIDSEVKILKTQSSAKLVAGEQGTWTITVAASGEDDATGVWVADMPLEGIDKSTAEFKNLSVGEIVSGSYLIDNSYALEGEVEAEGLYWFIGDLAAGEQATADVTALVEINASAAKNSAIVDSTWDGYDGGTEDNNTVEEDTDNYDEVEDPIETPDAPEPSSPADPGEPTPSEPGTPEPSSPADPGEPTPSSTVGEEAKTGGQATTAGIPVGWVLALGGIFLVALVTAAEVITRRKNN